MRDVRDHVRRRWYADYLSHPRHEPLPALLLVLTVFTGLVDAVSILALGRVFVANSGSARSNRGAEPGRRAGCGR